MDQQPDDLEALLHLRVHYRCTSCYCVVHPGSSRLTRVLGPLRAKCAACCSRTGRLERLVRRHDALIILLAMIPSQRGDRLRAPRPCAHPTARHGPTRAQQPVIGGGDRRPVGRSG